jgi:hypothetical protein
MTRRLINRFNRGTQPGCVPVLFAWSIGNGDTEACASRVLRV